MTERGPSATDFQDVSTIHRVEEPAARAGLSSLRRPPEDVLDPGELWDMVRGGWRVVLATGVVVSLCVALATVFSKMEFRSSGRLYLGELDRSTRPAASGVNGLELSESGSNDVAGEMEVIRSRSLVRRAILESGINVTVASRERRETRYLDWRLSGRDPGLLDSALAEVRAVHATLPARATRPATLQARFSSAEAYELFAEGQRLGAGVLERPVELPSLNVTLSKGTLRSPRAGAVYELTIQPLEEVTDRLLKALEVSTPKRATGNDPVNVVKLEFTYDSPYQTAQFLQRLMQAYLAERQSWKTEDASAAEAFVTHQLVGMRAALDQVETKLAEYRQNNRVVVLESEAKAMVEQIGKYEEQRVAARLQVAALADVQRVLRDPSPPMGAYLLGEANDTVLEGLAKSLSDSRQKLTELETRFSSAAPNVREQSEQVQAQLEAIRNYVASRSQRAQDSLGELNAIIAQFEAKLRTVPGAELGLAQLARESEVYNRTYSYLLERQQQAAIIKASTLSKNRVLDAPELPLREDTPKLSARVGIGLAGFVLGAIIVILRRAFASRFQSESDVRRGLPQAPVLAVFPARTLRRRVRRVPAATNGPTEAPTPAFVEAFRTLRAHLYRVARSRRGQIVLLTSASPGDGKTTCAEGLAAALAADGKSVLVIDADLRSGAAGNVTAAEPGLCAVLTDNSHWTSVVRSVPSSSGSFYRVASGGSGAPELLSSDRMLAFVEDARRKFDFILLDVPSFPQVSDALVLSSSADIVLSVVCTRNTPRRLAVEHVNRIGAVAPAHALVINDPLGASSRSPTRLPRGEGSPDSSGRAGRPGRFRPRLLVGALLALVAIGALLARQSVVLDGRVILGTFGENAARP